jgi:multidrug efflux pump subunit AcrA (membrane-fusion protein)
VAKVSTGPIDKVVRVTGSTQARDFASVSAPMMRGPDSGRALILTFLAKGGTIVKKGDVVAQIDAQAMKDHVDDINSQVIQADTDVKKRKAEQAIDWENLQQTLREAKATLDKARLDASASEVRTKIDEEILKLAVEEAEASLKQLQQDLKTKQAAYRAEIRILELTRERHQRHRDRHKVDVERFTIRAAMDGMVVIQTIWRMGEYVQIAEGDQVSPGQPFMKIVNPSSMLVDASISQVGSDEIRLGQPAVVHFDAFPDLKLKAKVYSMGAMATGGWRQNYYLRTLPVRLQIEEMDKRVIPDLSAAADILVEHKENQVRIPLEAVVQRDGKSYVYVWLGQRYELREVKLGFSSSTFASVLGGLKVGEEIALAEPPAEQLRASN